MTLLTLTTLKTLEKKKKKTVSSFAAEVIGPCVREMDTKSAMDPGVISALFEHGLMGVEVPEDHGGTFKLQTRG